MLIVETVSRQINTPIGEQDLAEASELRDLVRRARHNDPAAWRDLIGRYSGRVFALVQANLRDRDAAEEISQAVFVRVVEEFRKDRYEESGRFEPWLFRIAMNMVRDRARKQRTRGSHMQIRHDETGEPAVNERAEFTPLRDAISRLSEADQQIIQLRHHAELPFQTIAQLLEQPVGTLLARHHRAIAKLRAMLEETTPARGTA